MVLFPARRTVIILDNASSHTNDRIREAVEAYGCIVKYLPPYSPDFNPIELSFSSLKAWVRRYEAEIWPKFEGDFGEFLRYAVMRIQCDQFVVQHFRHSTYGRLVFEGDIHELNEQLYLGTAGGDCLREG